MISIDAKPAAQVAAANQSLTKDVVKPLDFDGNHEEIWGFNPDIKGYLRRVEIEAIVAKAKPVVGNDPKPFKATISAWLGKVNAKMVRKAHKNNIFGFELKSDGSMIFDTMETVGKFKALFNIA